MGKIIVRRSKGSKGNPQGRFNGQKQRRIRRLFFEKYGEHEEYICWICGGFVPRDKVTVDHVISVKDNPDLAFEPSNLQPAHLSCNQKAAASPPQPTKEQQYKGKNNG